MEQGVSIDTSWATYCAPLSCNISLVRELNYWLQFVPELDNLIVMHVNNVTATNETKLFTELLVFWPLRGPNKSVHKHFKGFVLICKIVLLID